MKGYRLFIAASFVIQTYVCFFAADYAPYSTALYFFALSADIAGYRYKSWRASSNVKKLIKDNISILPVLALCVLALCAVAIYTLPARALVLCAAILYAIALNAMALSAMGPHAVVEQIRSEVRRASRALMKLARQDQFPVCALGSYALAACILPPIALAVYVLAVCALYLCAARDEDED